MVHIKKSEQSEPIQIHHMNIMFDLFPNFCFNCDNAEDVELFHDTSWDVDDSAQSSY